ncbi:MAG: tRNA pseudouridine(38-40) synthase TruA, partial [Oscillospiraceae bacterium]|nr:tRNA pseudouridine(38-40) synthase TruA [Oscillospiraceae bacterium]
RAEGKARMKSTVRTIYDISVTEADGMCEVRISGNGFLYNMVRIVTGTLLYISEGRRTGQDILNALETGDRALSGITLPPCGLYLNKVFY